MPLDKKNILLERAGGPSSEELVAKGQFLEAAKAQEERDAKLFKNSQQYIDGLIAESVITEDYVNTRKHFNFLQQERADLLKIQERVEDYEAFNDQWEKNKISQLRGQFGNKNLPQELLDRVQSIKSEANLHGLRLVISKSREEFNDMVGREINLLNEDIENGDIYKALAHSEQIINEVNGAVSKGIYSKEEGDEKIKALMKSNSNVLVPGAIAMISAEKSMNGYQAGYDTYKQINKVLNPYIKAADIRSEGLWASFGKTLKAGIEDDKAQLAQLSGAYSSWLQHKTGSPRDAARSLYNMRNILNKHVNDPHKTADQRAYAAIQRSKIDGALKLNSVLGAALSGDSSKSKIISGANPRQLASLLGVREGSPEHQGAVADYASMRIGYQWAKDPSMAAYRFIKDVRGEDVPNPTDLQGILGFAHDQLNTLRNHGLPASVSQGTKNSIAELYNLPEIAPEQQRSIINFIQRSGVSLTKEIAKGTDHTFNQSYSHFATQNSENLPNTPLETPMSAIDNRTMLENTPRAKQNINKITSAILNDPIYFGQIERISDANGTTPSVVANAFAIDQVNKVVSGRAGALSLGALDSIEKGQILRNEQFNVTQDLERYLDGLKGKYSQYGPNNIIRNFEGNPLNQSGQFNSLFKDLMTDQESKGFFFKVGQNIKQAVSNTKLGVEYKAKIQDSIQELTGVPISTLNRLRIGFSPNYEHILFQVDQGDGTRSDLYYEGTNKPILIHLEDYMNAASQNQKISDKDFSDEIIDLLHSGVHQ